MQSIIPLRTLSDQAINLIQKSYPEGIALLAGSTLPQTGRALVTLVSKTAFISNGIFDIAETDNVYAVKILFRSLIEHYLKSEYLFARYLSDRNDSVGRDYNEFCDLQERMDEVSAQNRVKTLIDPQAPVVPPLQVLRQVNPDLPDVSSEEIRQRAAQFKYRSIIAYLLERIYRDKNVSDNNFLLSMIPKYSELSSFVHGGPTSDLYISSVAQEVRDNESFEMAQLGLLMATHVKYEVYVLLFSLDKQYESPCVSLSMLLRRILKVGAT